MSIYSSLLTTTGAAQYAYNEANALPTVLSQVVLGDNNGNFFTPSINNGVINHQVYVASINSITVDPLDSTIDNVEIVLPYNVGGWTIREFRIKDSNGTVMYTGNCEIAKTILSSGQAIETQIIFPIKRVNTANVTLNFDSANLATFQYVTNAINTHNSDLNAHGAANWATKVGVQNQQYSYASASGTTTAYVAAFSPAISALVSGTRVTVNTNSVGTNTTTTPTLNVNGLGAFTIVKQGGALAIGDMPKLAQLQYDSTLTQWVLLNPIVNASGLVASGINIVTTTSALTAAMVGGLVRFNSATAIAPTLPLASSYPAGRILKMINNNAGIATVTRSSSDTITVNSATVTSLALALGDTLELMSDGVSTWFAVGGSAQLNYSNAFYSTGGATSGVKKTPDGIIEQWGSATISTTWTTVSYVTPFTTTVYQVQGLLTDPSGTGYLVNALTSTTLSSTLFAMAGSTGSRTLMWRAWGK